MGDFRMSEKEINILIETHKYCSNKKIAYKLNVLILLAKNYTYNKVRNVLLLEERTVRNWKNIYLEKGVTGILEIFF